MNQQTIELPQGQVAYRDMGEGPAVVFSHGLFVNARFWDGVSDHLVAAGFRCLLPDLPMGSHRIPLKPEAEISPPGIAKLLGDFIDALGLEDVTLVGNDSGGAVSQMLVAEHPEKVATLVLTNCDALEVYPPFPFTLLPHLAKVPGAVKTLAQGLRIKPIRTATYGVLTERPIPDALLMDWLKPMIEIPGVRHDATKVLKGVDSSHLLALTDQLGRFDKPVLLAWGAEDRVFKVELARRLAAVFPNAKLELIENARTFSPLDRPEEVARLIQDFLS